MSKVTHLSFWQDNYNLRIRAKALRATLDVTNSRATVMSSALTKLSSGLSSIANQKAIDRVQAQIKSVIATGIQSGGIKTPTSGTSGTSVNKSA